MTVLYEQYQGGLASLNRIDEAALDWIRAVDLALYDDSFDVSYNFIYLF